MTKYKAKMKRLNETSFFLKFHNNSVLADNLFCLSPEYEKNKVAIIQLMLIDDGFILAEIINL